MCGYCRGFPDIVLIKNEENLGFAEGNNRGILYALDKGAEYILLLNNDAIVDPDILKAFMQAAKQNPKAGVFGAQIFLYDRPTEVWYGGGEVNFRKARCYHEARTELCTTGYACGCALFVSSEAVRRVGLMDPRFFLLWEEIDWCWRIRQAGYECLFVPKALVWHKVSSSFEGGNHGALWHYYNARNRLVFLAKHFSLKQRALTYLSTILPETAAAALKSLGNPRHRARLQGTVDYFLGRFGKSGK